MDSDYSRAVVEEIKGSREAEWDRISRTLSFGDFFIVKGRTPQGNVNGQADEKIPKEEAVCRFCFNVFGEDNVLKTKCNCKFALIHESCAIEWSQKKGNNKCDVCEQDIENIPVTLSRNQFPSSQGT